MNKFPLSLPIAAACVFACSLVAQAQTTGTDGFAARPPLVLGSGEIATGFASNESASAEFGEADHMAQPAERSIWWSWTAATGGVVEIDTIDSTFLTRLVVYTGSSLSLLEPVAGNVTDIATPNIESVVRFVAVPGTTYSIVVDGYNEFIAETGQIFLTLAHPAPGTPPANDNFSGAESLGNAASATASGDTSAASVEALEPDPETTFIPTGPGRSVWYLWTAPSTAFFTVQVDGGGAQWETALGIYQGSALGALTQVDKGEELSFEPASSNTELSMATFAAVAGQTYRIMVAARSFATTHGVFDLVLKPALRPANDDISGATDLGAANQLVTQLTLLESTRQPGEPNHFASFGFTPSYSSSSVWAKWIAPSAGMFTVDTRGSDGDTILAVYRAPTVPPTFGSLQAVTAGDDINIDAGVYSSVASFNAPVAGATYYFAVSGYALSSHSPLRLAGGPPRVPFDAWLLDFPALTGAAAAKSADPDFDGFPNIVELMLGTDPTAESNGAAIDGALVPSVTIEDGRLYLDVGFFRDNVNGLSDGAGSGGLPLGVTAQQTADLVTWTEVPFEDMFFGSLTASASVPVNGGAALLRFEVFDPNP